MIAAMRANSVDPGWIAQIREASKARLATDPELVKLTERTLRIHERWGRKELVFNEAILKAEREALGDPDKEVESATDEDAKQPAFGSNPYTKEVLAITADLVRHAAAGGGGK